MKSFPFGARIKHVLRIEVNDSLEDPDTIAIYFVNPAGVQTGPISPTKEAKGQYIYTKIYSAAGSGGDWWVKWVGGPTGENAGVEEHQFHINTSPFNV